MISKETFCAALSLIKEQEATDEQFSKALSKVGDGHFLFGIGNKYLVALRMVLKGKQDDFQHLNAVKSRATHLAFLNGKIFS